MQIVYLTADLLFASRIEQAARQQSVGLSIVRNAEAALAAIGEQTQLLMIDLTLSGLDIASLVADARDSYPTLQILAYGPHVQAARLEAAREAGCHQVLTRGQFDREATAIISAANRPTDS